MEPRPLQHRGYIAHPAHSFPQVFRAVHAQRHKEIFVAQCRNAPARYGNRLAPAEDRVHGASAIRNGKAFLFSGISGAGKTTISRLAPHDTTVLTDEISYVRFHGGSYRACGTPFAGELARVGENAQAPIEHLFFLAKGPENRIESIRPSDALRMLLRNILFFADDSTLVEAVFRSACQFLERVPVSRLTFYPDVHALFRFNPGFV